MKSLRPITALALLPVLFLLVSCQSGREPGSASMASVRIEGATREQVLAVTKAVFAEDGYTLAGNTPGALAFERAGSRRDALKYGGWSGEGVTLRVNLRFSTAGDGAELIQADVRAIRDAGDPFFADDSKAMLPGRAKYQKMLDEVRSRLKKK